MRPAWISAPTVQSTLRRNEKVCCRSVQVGLVAGAGLVSPFRVEHPVGETTPRAVPWLDVLRHTRTKLGFVDQDIDVQVIDVAHLEAADAPWNEIDVLLLVTDSQANLQEIEDRCGHATSILHLATVGDSQQARLGPLTKLGGIRPARSLMARLPIPGNGAARAVRKDAQLMEELFNRSTAEDLLYMNMLLINNYTSLTVPGVASTLAADGDTGQKIWECCSKELIECAKDSNCRNCMLCLAKCPANDQVSAYRCIVSNESAQLQKTNLCIFEQNNCLGNCAEIPMNPDPMPMTKWQNRTLSFEDSEDIFFGWLNKGLEWSWKVCAGQNPAYDHFSHQHQLWFRKGKAMWYDPVFQVTKMDGEKVWRRRHYRVRRGDNPGQFYFSVVDNGVISREYWRILSADQELSYALFYYSGAATTAGFTYKGAILATPDGAWPTNPNAAAEIEKSLDLAGIKVWELIFVDNAPLGHGTQPPPLQLPSGSATSHASP